MVDTDLAGFDRDVLQASVHGPVLVDFWAEWCAPCLVIAPVLQRVIEELDGAVALVKLEVDVGDNMKLAGRYHVRGFPTVILFQDGREISRFSGARSYSQIIAFLEEHLGLPDIT